MDVRFPGRGVSVIAFVPRRVLDCENLAGVFSTGSYAHIGMECVTSSQEEVIFRLIFSHGYGVFRHSSPVSRKEVLQATHRKNRSSDESLATLWLSDKICKKLWDYISINVCTRSVDPKILSGEQEGRRLRPFLTHYIPLWIENVSWSLNSIMESYFSHEFPLNGVLPSVEKTSSQRDTSSRVEI